jgi:hypothetical protein
VLNLTLSGLDCLAFMLRQALNVLLFAFMMEVV